jgi:hypothetical protein
MCESEIFRNFELTAFALHLGTQQLDDSLSPLLTEIKYTLHTRMSGTDVVASLNIVYHTEAGV